MFSERMRWKLLLFGIVVLAIAALLLLTDVGIRFTNILREGLGGITSFFYGVSSKSSFPIILTVKLENKNSFFDQEFKLTDSSFSSSGSITSLKVDEGKEVIPGIASVSLRGINGKLEIIAPGNLKISGEASYIKINDMERKRETPYKIELEINPFDCSDCSFMVENIESNLKFNSLTGEIKKLKSEGRVDWIKPLSNEMLEIYNFKGVLQLTNNSLVLSGMTTQIKGEGFSF